MGKQQHSLRQPQPSVATSIAGWRRLDTIVVVVIVAVTVAVFANTLRGPFIYDDTMQIAQNQLIQQNKHIWTALTSDVWAFKGEKEEPWSNYWRPMFVVWLMVSYRLFGVDSTVGWHAGNILLHALVATLAYGWLRWLNLAWPLAFAIVLIFVVHPVQVESVAWISGSPNMLSAAGMLGALWLVISAWQRPRPWKRGAAVLLFALGVMAKETVSLFPLLVLVTIFVLDRAPGASFASRAGRALREALPFVLVTVAFFSARYFILGQFFVHAHETEGPGNVLATLPSVLAFYIRQTIFPYWIGPSYGLRPITYAQVDLMNVGLPLALIIIMGTLLVAAADRDPVRQIGLAFFLTTFAPALNIRAFYLENIVQDRYLYLPLLGVLTVIIPAAARSLSKLIPMSAWRAQWVCLMVAMAVCVPLTLQTVRYNRLWTNEVSLWERGVQTNAHGVISWTQYGYVLRRAGRNQEAKAAFERALAIRYRPSAMISLGVIAMEEGKTVQAERYFREVIRRTPDVAAAYDQLMVCYHRQGRLEEAANVIRQGRAAIPQYKGRFTANLAVILHQAGKKEEALAELESIREYVEEEHWSDAHRALFLLGTLYEEMGRPADARAALEEYLRISSGYRDGQTLVNRRKAEQTLAKLRGS
ncbi:MAG: tetratricopeptide repeat protein [Acidobacteriota bacterium]|nr:tetratricopeptide repeat protein [Blastocatellia bacterium]MDW8238838.1 tetratricopeptide repeat protein [Acidobacteriota bacterium]